LTPAGWRCFHAFARGSPMRRQYHALLSVLAIALARPADAYTPPRTADGRPDCRAFGRTTPRRRWNGRRCFKAARSSRTGKSQL
jgi:hypothetical protein